VKYTGFLKIVEAINVAYSSIKRETKYYNYHGTKKAVAGVTLQTCYQTKKKLQRTNVSNVVR